MRIFITGATGAIGQRLLPQLKERGHQLVASVRSAGRLDRLRALGVESVILDLLDPDAVRLAVCAARPDAIIHEATALGGVTNLKHFDRSFALTNQLRTRATDNLISAARASGVRKVVAQSYTGWPYGRGGGQIKTEDDPLDPYPVPSMRESLEVIKHLEHAVVGAGGIALRYGAFYGALSAWTERGLPSEVLRGRAREPSRGFPTQRPDAGAGAQAPCSRSSATAAASGRGCTSMMQRPRPCSRSSAAAAASTTSPTTIRRRCASGCRRSPRPSVRHRRAGFRASSRA